MRCATMDIVQVLKLDLERPIQTAQDSTLDGSIWQQATITSQ